MASDGKPIQPGCVYWIEHACSRFKARVLKRSLAVRDWWICTNELGIELPIPETAIKELAEDSPPG